MYSYQAKKSFRAVKRGSNPLVYKNIDEGMSFNGEEELNNRPALVVDEEGYIMPLEWVKKVGAPVVSNLPQDIQQKVNEIKSKSLVKDILKKSNYSTNGSLIGAGIGAFLALYYNKSVLWFTLGGMVGGGLVGRYILKNEPITE